MKVPDGIDVFDYGFLRCGIIGILDLAGCCCGPAGCVSGRARTRPGRSGRTTDTLHRLIRLAATTAGRWRCCLRRHTKHAEWMAVVKSRFHGAAVSRFHQGKRALARRRSSDPPSLSPSRRSGFPFPISAAQISQSHVFLRSNSLALRCSSACVVVVVVMRASTCACPVWCCIFHAWRARVVFLKKSTVASCVGSRGGPWTHPG